MSTNYLSHKNYCKPLMKLTSESHMWLHSFSAGGLLIGDYKYLLLLSMFIISNSDLAMWNNHWVWSVIRTSIVDCLPPCILLLHVIHKFFILDFAIASYRLVVCFITLLKIFTMNNNALACVTFKTGLSGLTNTSLTYIIQSMYNSQYYWLPSYN